MMEGLPKNFSRVVIDQNTEKMKGLRIERSTNDMLFVAEKKLIDNAGRKSSKEEIIITGQDFVSTNLLTSHT